MTATQCSNSCDGKHRGQTSPDPVTVTGGEVRGFQKKPENQCSAGKVRAQAGDGGMGGGMRCRSDFRLLPSLLGGEVRILMWQMRALSAV